MIAVDTNLVVRFLIPADDPGQAAKAKALFGKETVFVPTTVLLETAWVLGRVYKVPVPMVASALRSLFGITNVRVEEPERLRQALEWMRDGLEFADAFHLASAHDCEALVTFDKAFVKAARDLDAPVVRLP